MTITYEDGSGLYINSTNRCTNSCDFCVRVTEDGHYGDLWLESEPTVEEMIADIDKRDLSVNQQRLIDILISRSTSKGKKVSSTSEKLMEEMSSILQAEDKMILNGNLDIHKEKKRTREGKYVGVLVCFGCCNKITQTG